ncbi:MAG TPA: hypothetical protein PKO06_04380, partial [Candidatus Ozemobacteraceae bacterium]|nr:hypothetical protein [Candidatus Ozemobacteraceae bacterium]
SAQRQKATLVCTEKDLVKIPVSWATSHSLHVFSIKLLPDEQTTFLEVFRRQGLSLPASTSATAFEGHVSRR